MSRCPSKTALQQLGRPLYNKSISYSSCQAKSGFNPHQPGFPGNLPDDQYYYQLKNRSIFLLSEFTIFIIIFRSTLVFSQQQKDSIHPMIIHCLQGQLYYFQPFNRLFNSVLRPYHSTIREILKDDLPVRFCIDSGIHDHQEATVISVSNESS